jgi:shikimate dehydrogenase
MRLFGLIGYPLTHSFSKKYFSEKFERENITDSQYELFPLSSIAELPKLLHDHPELEGLNVTIPYKKNVVSFLDENLLPTGLDACNCIRIQFEKLIGYNTDAIAFEKTLTPLLRPHHTKALVLGTGGAAAAILFVLNKIGIVHTSVSRNSNDKGILNYDRLDGRTIREHTLIINTTPVGTFPGTDKCPDIPYSEITKDHLLYDLVYNPTMTMFLKKGADRGAVIKNGEEMLKEQAEESWRIWNG